MLIRARSAAEGLISKLNTEFESNTGAGKKREISLPSWLKET